MRTTRRRATSSARVVRTSQIGPLRVPDALLRARPNLLIVGPPARTSQILPWQFFRDPITRCRANVTPLVLPVAGGGTLVLQHVEALSKSAQLALRRWLDRDGRRTQVVSLAERNLFPLVEAGAFRDDLYYRLNVIYLEVGRPIGRVARASLRR